jgi:hypothetical protein
MGHGSALTSTLRRVQKLPGKAGYMGQFGQKFSCEIDLALRDRCAFTRVPDGVLQEPRGGQFAAHARAVNQRLLPARNRTGNRIGGQWAASGNRFEAPVGIKINRCCPGRAAAGVDGNRRLTWLGYQPKAVAANGVHMRVHHSDRGCRGDHGFDGVAAFAQDRAGAASGQVVGSGHHAARRSQGLAHAALSVIQKLGCHGV